MPRVGRPRRRGPLLPTLLVLVLAVIAFLVFADFYTDWLWYKSIGFSNVYSTRLRSQIVLFLVFGLLTGGAVALNAWLAYRFRPPFRGLSVEQQSLERYRVSVEPYRRFITPILGIVIGLMAGSSASSHWRSWLMFRNSVPFGQKDPQFRMDVSFFAFRLPVLALSARFRVRDRAALPARHACRQLPLRRHQARRRRGERLTPAARVQVSVLLGVFVLLKAVAYWLDRFALVLDQHNWAATRRRRHRCQLHGRQGPPAREEHPARRRADLRRALLRQRVGRKLGSCRRSAWACSCSPPWSSAGSIPRRAVLQVQARASRQEAPYIQRNIDATQTRTASTASR